MKSGQAYKEESERASDDEDTIDEQYYQLYVQFESFMYQLHEVPPP
jgi:hypothetical protein